MKNKKFLFSKKEHPCRQSLHLQPNQVRNPMVLFIPERLLIEHPFRLSDVRQNITLKTTLRAITALTHCFQNIEWCHGPSLEDEKSKDGVYNSYLHGYDAKWDEEERGGTELEREVRKNEKLAAKNMYQRKFEEKLNRFKKEKPSANFFALRVDKKKKTETCYRRTRAFLEYVMNDDESRAGIRFWIFTLDPKVNFGAGIERLILENQRDENDHDRKYRRGQRVKPLDPKPWESYYELKDKTVWSFGVCDGYTGNSDCRSKMKDIYHERKSLYHHENPANPHNVFSVERSFTLFEKDLRGVTDSGQATYQNYYTYQNGRMQWFPQNNRRFSKYFFEMSFEKMHPKLLFCMHLPTLDTCRLGLHELAKDFNFNPEVIQMFQMRDLVLSQADAKRDGDMHELEEMNQVLLRNIRKGEDLHGNPISEEKKARLLRAFRRRSMEAFINLWNEDSKISNICHVLISWYNERRKKRESYGLRNTMSYTVYQYDPHLSVFANWVIQKFMALERFMQVSCIHKEMFIGYIARLDAYRRSFDLHSNILCAGQGATSKSFMFNCLMKMSVDLTMHNITYQTAKSDCIDENQNDRVTFYEEMPPSLMGIDPKFGATDTGDPIFKAKLTAGKTISKRYARNEITGAVTNVVAVSEQVGCIFGATNDPLHKVPEAMLTRFWPLMFSKHEARQGRAVQELIGSTMTQKNKDLKADFIESCHLEQYLTAVVEKMIWCGVLEDVNQTISDKIFNNVCDYLYKKGVHKAKQPRNFTRLRNTARTLTILNALNIVFNHTPRYKNRTFYLKQIRDVEPYLVVTEEIAYFTLTLSEAVFINPILPYVVEVIALNLCHCGAGQEPNYYLNPLTEETDYDYVCFEATSVEAAAHNIHKYMTKVKASPNNIVLLLRELWNTTYDFVPRDGHGHCKTTLVNGDEIQIDPIPMSILKKEGAGGKHIMMSKAFIEMVGKDKQVMHEAIKETFHCKIRPRRILTGETYLRDTNEPQYLKTLEIKPGPNYFSFINTNHTNSIENMVYTGFHSVEKPFYFVDDDFERLVFQKHWMNCGFPRDQMEKLMKNFLPQEVEKAIQKNNTYSHTMNKKYPNDYQKENKICTAEIRNLQTNQKEKVRKGTYNFSNLLRKKRKFS